MDDIDLVAVQRIIEEVAAAEIMPRFRKLAAGDIEMKGINDPVTVADHAAEAALMARFELLFPGCVFVAEEFFARDPTLISNFAGYRDVVVIDPIDGTRNFIEGRPEFAVMVAIVRHRKTLAAWIHDPNSGDTLMAKKGSGVTMRGKPMRLAGKEPSVSRLGIIGSRLRDALPKPDVARAVASLPALAIGGAVSFDYARLFTGEAHFANSAKPRATFLLYRMCKPWDHIPGLFLHAEAGGYAADLAGRPYDMQNGRTGLIVASDPEVWNRLHRIVQPVVGALAATDACEDEMLFSRAELCNSQGENSRHAAESPCETAIFSHSAV